MWEKELSVAIKAGIEAKKAIMEIYRHAFDVEIKEDDSPVTLADKTADTIIKDILSKNFPEHAFLTEESEDDLSRRNNDYCWIIDPVDGTKDFVAKNDEFTTNIALSFKGEIVVGVILIPAQDVIYFATKNGGCYKRIGDIDSLVRVNNKLEDLTVLTSRFHVKENELATIKKHQDKIKYVETYGSALKACRIAEGLAEITYRLSDGTKEWDTAASQIVILEAGGVFVKPNGEQMVYNREDVYNREGYIIANRKENVLL